MDAPRLPGERAAWWKAGCRTTSSRSSRTTIASLSRTTAWALSLLNQFDAWIDEMVSRNKMYLDNFDAPIQELFYRDQELVDVALTRGMKVEEGYAYSLFLSPSYQHVRDAAVAGIRKNFHHGVPMTSSRDAFLLEHAVDWLGSRLGLLPQPFFGYFHYLPPHAPYTTSAEFYDRFAGDGLRTVEKPLSDFGDTRDRGGGGPGRAASMMSSFFTWTRLSPNLYTSLEAGGYLENTLMRGFLRSRRDVRARVDRSRWTGHVRACRAHAADHL